MVAVYIFSALVVIAIPTALLLIWWRNRKIKLVDQSQIQDQSTEKGEEQKIKKQVQKMTEQRKSMMSGLQTAKVAPQSKEDKIASQLSSFVAGSGSKNKSFSNRAGDTIDRINSVDKIPEAPNEETSRRGTPAEANRMANAFDNANLF